MADHRDIELRLLSPYDLINTNHNFIVGIILTTKRGGIPPKHNTQTGATGPLGLDPDEGLGYANVFLYEPDRNLLLYEFNKNGTYLNQFIDFVKIKGQQLLDINLIPGTLPSMISVDLNPLLKTEAYERMLSIGNYRVLEISIANPTEFMEYVDHGSENGQSLLELTSPSRLLNSPKFKATYSCGHLITSSLNAGAFRRIIDALRYGMTTRHGKNIEKIKLRGYYQDPELGTVLQPIDLLADRYIKQFNLPEPNELIDFQEGQRREEIVSLYRSCLHELSRLI